MEEHTEKWISGVKGEDRDKLLSYGEYFEVKGDDVLILEGNKQDTLYLLLEGELEAQAKSHRSHVVLGIIKAGESVGEMSVIDPFVASATIKAREKARLWRIKRDQFETFIEENPVIATQVLKYLATTMARRVRKAGERLVRQADSMYYDWD